jgi:uncharacterized protein (TIGR01244 family)
MRTTLPLAFLVLLGCQSTAPARPSADDVRAIDIPYTGTPMPGIVTAGQPSEAQLAQLAELGVRNVINLRAAGEDGTGWEAQKAQELGIRYVNLPIAGAQDITVENARLLAQEIGRSGGGNTLVYCASSNRVGALLALKARFVDGKSPEEALAIGKAAGVTRLEPKVKELLGLGQ